MKKFFYAFAALALMMGATSCSSDEVVPATGEGDTEVTFIAGMDAGVVSRGQTPSNGKLATNLQVVAYLSGTKTVATSTTATLEDLTASVTLKLVKGRKYDVVFWAQADKAPYTFDTANQCINVDYTDAVSNDEKRDAFYALDQVEVSDDTQPINVKMKRPFSKLTIATSATDYNAASKGRPYYTTMDVDVYSKFNVISGDVEGEPSTVTFAANHYLGSDGYPSSFSVSGVTYAVIGTNYLLTKPTNDVVNCTFTYGDLTTTANAETNEVTTEYKALYTKTFANIPVTANYWTMILGDFFTKSVNYNVTVSPSVDGYYINPASLDSNVEATVFAGGSCTLEDDLTLNHTLMVGTGEPTEVDLNGKTLTINASYSTSLGKGANLTFSNGTIKCENPSGASTTANFWVGPDATLTLKNVKFESDGSPIYPQGNAATVVIEDSEITGGSYAVATNANNYGNWNVVIDIKNSTLKGVTPVLVNIPSQVNLTNCKLYGTVQGMVVRGGTVSISGGEINLLEDKITDDSAESYYNDFRTTTWGSGNGAPVAALTVGNRHATSYLYPTYLTLQGVTVNGVTHGEYQFPAMYVYANDATNNVNLTVDDACSFNGPIEYASDNIFLNGEAAK
jgi:hypothetical protein